jgi:hypothetical protein
MIVRLELDGSLLTFLVRLGWLDDDRSHDPAAVAEAIVGLLADADEADRRSGR